MIDKKYFHYLFVAFMTLGMTLVMSFVTAFTSESTTGQFISTWLSNSALGFIIAFPTALVVTPYARIATEKLTAEY